MVNIANLVLSFGLAVVVALTIAAITTPQVEILVRPNPRAPTYHCDVTLHFYNRRTECPGRPTTNIRTPRDEGFFGCVAAWDKYQTSFGLVTISCIVSAFALLLSLMAAFTPPSFVSARARSFIITALCALSFVTATISWPLVRSQTTQKQCGRMLKGYLMPSYTLVLDHSVGAGHILAIVAWCVSFVVLIGAAALSYAAAKTPAQQPFKSVEDKAEGSSSSEPTEFDMIAKEGASCSSNAPVGEKDEDGAAVFVVDA